MPGAHHSATLLKVSPSALRSTRLPRSAATSRPLRRREIDARGSTRSASAASQRAASAPSTCCCRERRRSSCCSALAAVMSVRIETYCRGRPCASHSGTMVDATQYRLPSCRRLQTSPCQTRPAAMVCHMSR
jgi:hypothetical protein